MKALWIRVEAHEVDSKLVDQLASMLSIPDAHALGLYVALGGSVAENAPDGVISDISDTKLEAWAHWSGRRGAFAKVARAILQNDDGEIVGWAESMGQLIERRKRDLARKERGNSTEIPRKERGNSTATERNGTERNGTLRNVPASSSHPESSKKRAVDLSGERVRENHDAPDDRERPAPLNGPRADARTRLEPLGMRVLAWFERYYARAPERRQDDVASQLEQLAAGRSITYRGGAVRAFTPARLATKCAAMLDEDTQRDPDAAIGTLLSKLGDTSDVTEAQADADKRAATDLANNLDPRVAALVGAAAGARAIPAAPATRRPPDPDGGQLGRNRIEKP